MLYHAERPWSTHSTDAQGIYSLVRQAVRELPNSRLLFLPRKKRALQGKHRRHCLCTSPLTPGTNPLPFHTQKGFIHLVCHDTTLYSFSWLVSICPP